MRPPLPALLLLIAATLPAPALAEQDDNQGSFTLRHGTPYAVNGGEDFPHGNGEVLIRPLSLAYTLDTFELTVTAPFRGAADGNGMAAPVIGFSQLAADSASQRVASVPSASIRLAYTFDFGDRLYLDPTVRLRNPLGAAHSDGWQPRADITTGADLVREFDSGSVYVHVARRFVGGPYAFADRDVWASGAGLEFDIASRITLGADYSRAQSPYRGERAESEMSGWVEWTSSRGIAFSGYAGVAASVEGTDLFAGTEMSFGF